MTHHGRAPRLSRTHWPAGAYPRAQLPERVLQFGTGMLLRALSAAAVDAANRAGRFNGSIVVVQSTPHGVAATMNAQSGLFTLVERGLENGAPVQRTRLIGAISRALVAADEWDAVRAVVTRPELQVIVSNVTEAGFRADAPFPERLTDLLRARFAALPEGPPLFVIPTELVRDNGPRLGEMVLDLAGRSATDRAFRDWLSRGVRFCSSLVDRITTGSPPPDVGAELEALLGYSDALLTVAEPYSLWAIESDPSALSAAFPIEAPPGVVFAPDIAFYSVRKLRLLNGSHTAMAPLALLSGVATVREATEHSQLGWLQRRILFDEIVPGTDLPADEALAFAHEVMDRFRNPWLEHRWEVIATNQTPKLRERVLPSVAGFAARCGRVPQGLALACAASLRFARCIAQVSETEGHGWWRGAPYAIRDADLPRLVAHWWAVDPEHAPGPVPVDILQRLAARALPDASLWGGTTFASVPRFVDATTRALCRLEESGVEGAITALDGG